MYILYLLLLPGKTFVTETNYAQIALGSSATKLGTIPTHKARFLIN